MILFGDHALKAYTHKQNIIARSSAKAELCAAALGASESKGIVSLLKDLGYEMKPVLAIDAKATEHILQKARDWETGAHRCGLFVDARRNQIQEVASTKGQERRKRCRPGNQTTQQSSDCEALPHAWLCQHSLREMC